MVLSRLPGLLAAVPLLVIGSAASAQPTDPLLLTDVLTRVVEASPTLSADRLEAAAARTRSDQVSAWRDPMISATVNTGPGRMQRSEIMVEQAFPWPDVLRARADAAEAGARSVGSMADATLADLILETTKVYVEAAGIELMIGHLEHFHSELAAFERAAAVQYEMGLGPQQAILRMQLEKNGLVRRRLELSSRAESLRESLTRLAGGDPEAGWSGRPLVLPEPQLGPDRTPDASGVRLRPEWNAYTSSLERLDAEREVARKAFRPDFSVHASWMEGSVMRGGKDAFGFGIGLRLPIWRAPLHAAVEEKELERRRVEALMDDFEIRTLSEARASLIRIESLVDLLDLVDEVLLPQGEATQQATAAAYTNGRADYQDLLEAERVLLDLRIERVELQVRLLTEQATLARLMPPSDGESTTDP